jgi:hypothetical protein
MKINLHITFVLLTFAALILTVRKMESAILLFTILPEGYVLPSHSHCENHIADGQPYFKSLSENSFFGSGLLKRFLCIMGNKKVSNVISDAIGKSADKLFQKTKKSCSDHSDCQQENSRHTDGLFASHNLRVGMFSWTWAKNITCL